MSENETGGSRGREETERGEACHRTDEECGAACACADDDDEDDVDGDFSEPDYDHLFTGEDDVSVSSHENMPSSPDYNHLGACAEDFSAMHDSRQEPMGAKAGAIEDEDCYPEKGKDEMAEEYILGTLMVRVLQAKHLKVRG